MQQMAGRRGPAVLWLSAAAAVLIIGIVAIAVGMVGLDGDDPNAPSAAGPAEAPPSRRPTQVTIDLDPADGYVATVRGTDASRQFLTARDFLVNSAGGGRYAGEVSAFDPGTFDAAPLQGGEVVDVSGHDARYVPAYRFAATGGDGKTHSSPAVGWQDPSGVWLLVYVAPGEQATRADLIRLAGSVTLTQPRDLLTPFRIGTMPNGLAVTYVQSSEEKNGSSGAIGLSDPRRKASAAAVYDGSAYGVTVSIDASVPNPAWTAERSQLSGKTKVGGHDAWYLEGKNPLSSDGMGSSLFVETKHCVVRIRTADRAAISRTELNRTVAAMAIGDCGDPDTWITPLA